MAEHMVHQGRNVKRIREMLLIKQEALAIALGDDWTQKKISQLESKAEIEPEILKQVAGVLKVPVEAIQQFDEEFAVNIFNNTFTDSHHSPIGYVANYSPNFNPLDKYVEQVEEIKRLYERLLQSEQEKNAVMQQLIDRLKG